jgi:predicted NUDIX family phosphoesterase
MEKVLAVPTTAMQTLAPAGFQKIEESKLIAFVNENGQYYDRTPQLEENASLKQIIPYVVVSCGDKILMYNRTAKQTDARLHMKYSIGFGGHINPEDTAGHDNPVVGGRTRELQEELG